MEASGIKCATPTILYDFIQIFNTKRPVERLEDLDGLKLRIGPYATALAFAKKVGMEAVSVPPLEVVTALETGMLDGAMDALVQVKMTSVAENCPYFTDNVNAILTQQNIIVSKIWFDTLPSDIQTALVDVLTDINQQREDIWAEAAASNLAEYKANPDNVISSLTPEERNRWVELTKPVWREYKADVPEFQDVIDAAEAVR